MKILNYRLVIFILSIIFGVVFSMPSFLQTETGKKISLGLDLQGGLHMLLGVQTDEAVTVMREWGDGFGKQPTQISSKLRWS